MTLQLQLSIDSSYFVTFNDLMGAADLSEARIVEVCAWLLSCNLWLVALHNI